MRGFLSCEMCGVLVALGSPSGDVPRCFPGISHVWDPDLVARTFTALQPGALGDLFDNSHYEQLRWR